MKKEKDESAARGSLAPTGAEAIPPAALAPLGAVPSVPPMMRTMGVQTKEEIVVDKGRGWRPLPKDRPSAIVPPKTSIPSEVEIMERIVSELPTALYNCSQPLIGEAVAVEGAAGVAKDVCFVQPTPVLAAATGEYAGPDARRVHAPSGSS